jgi:cytosine/adenosine deaminase-related metal-dependent hydrolase
MPGFITTHHHQYETLQRSIIADGLLAGAWPQETYASVVQNIWTAGRIADPRTPGRFIWDLGRVPYDPEDCYIAELVACLSEITQGITTGTDTSQANHTPAHTDAMIKGLMDSGRRMVFAYSAGTDRSADGFPFEYPGAMNDTTKGIGRIAKAHFASRNQLVTLALPVALARRSPTPRTRAGNSVARLAPRFTITSLAIRKGSSVRLRTHEMARTGPT